MALSSMNIVFAWIKHFKKLSKNYKIEGPWLQKDIKLPMYHFLRKFWDINFFCGTITLWAISRDNLEGQKSLGPLIMSLEMAHKVIVPEKNLCPAVFLNSGTLIVKFGWLRFFYRLFSLVILTWASPRSNFYRSVKLDFNDFPCLMFKEEGWNDCDDSVRVLSGAAESIATLPPFGPIEGQKWFDQISSQWESQKNRFSLIYFGKIQF